MWLGARQMSRRKIGDRTVPYGIWDVSVKPAVYLCTIDAPTYESAQALCDYYNKQQGS